MKIINFSVAIVLSLSVYIKPMYAENTFVIAKSSVDKDAYDYYQKGLNIYSLHTPKNYEEAIKLFDKSLEISPEYTEALAGKALSQSLLAYRLRQNEKDYYQLLNLARVNAERAVKLNPNIAVSNIALSAVYKFQHNTVKGLEYASRAVKIEPENADAYFWIWYNSNEQNPNDSNILKAIKLAPNMLIAHSERGSSFLKNSNTTYALAEYQTVLKLNPNFVYVYNNLGALYGKEDDFEKATFYFKKALEKEPEDIEAIRNITMIYEKHDNKYISKNELMNIYRKALIINPDSSTILEKIRSLETDKKQLEKFYKDILENSKNTKLSMILADLYYQQNKLKEAANIYDEINKTSPKLLKNNKNILSTYYKMDIYSKVADIINIQQYNARLSISENDWKKSETHEKLGDYFYEDDNIETALVAYRKAVSILPNNSQLRIKLAKAIDNNEDDDNSLNIRSDEENSLFQYKKAVELEPNNKEYLSLLANKYLAISDKKSAIDLYKRIIIKNPSDIDTLLNLASTYYYDNPNEGIKYYNDVLKVDKSNFKANNALGDYFYKRNDLEQALKYFKNAILVNSYDQTIHNKIANIYIKMGREQEAKNEILNGKLSQYQLRLQRGYDDSDAHYQMANIYKKEGMFNQAILEFKEVIKLNPSFSDALKGLSDVYKEQSEKVKQEAILIPLKKAISLNPKNPANYINLAHSYKKIGDYDNAEIQYKEALKINSSLSEVYNYLSEIYKLKSDLENKKAIQAERLEPYKYIIQSNPYNHKAIYETAMNFKSQGKISNAIIGFEEAVKINDSIADYHYQLADCYKLLNNDKMYELEIKKACQLSSFSECNTTKSNK
jgi:tetratricopeptide (TPR) repeat protein